MMIRAQVLLLVLVAAMTGAAASDSGQEVISTSELRALAIADVRAKAILLDATIVYPRL
jgi:hypothetical protein